MVSRRRLVGKAAAAFVPSVAIAYALYFITALSVRFRRRARGQRRRLAHAAAARANPFHAAPRSRAGDVRVAQQLATLAGLPLLAFTSLLSFQLIKPSVPLAIGLALLAADIVAWRVGSQLFDRERLITGSQVRPAAAHPSRAS